MNILVDDEICQNHSIKIGVSLVLYNEPEVRLLNFLESLNNTFANYSIKIRAFCNSRHTYELPDGISVLQSDFNVGYGSGHSDNFDWFCQNNFTKVLITNTDLRFDGDAKSFLGNNQAVLVAPLIKNIDGSIQRVTRSFPTLLDKIKSFFFDYPYFLEYEAKEGLKVPHVSGCCLLVNVKEYSKLGYESLFDRRYFMYEEDTDLCRRLFGRGTIYLDGNLSVYHEYGRGSSGSAKLFITHLRSLLIYFSKWGIRDRAAHESRNIISILNEGKSIKTEKRDF